MPTEAKRETVAELREELAKARTMIVSEYRGLKVKEIAEIRRSLRKQDVTYRVVKNRLLRIAASDSVAEALGPLLVGPTAIAFGNDEAGTAKAVLDATRPSQSPIRSQAVRIPGAPVPARRLPAQSDNGYIRPTHSCYLPSQTDSRCRSRRASLLADFARIGANCSSEIGQPGPPARDSPARD